MHACTRRRAAREEEKQAKRESFTRTTSEHNSKQEQMTSRMSFVWCAIALACAAAVAATQIATVATTHEVGDKEGWGIPKEVTFYDTWAADKTFNVGDKLEFKWVGVHDVAEVTKEEYENCTKAGKPHTTSPVTISLDAAGSKYFICTVGPHCTLGQKLSVTVGSNSSTTTPTTPTAAAPAPSSAPASLLASALSAAMFTIGSMFFICL